MRTLKKNKQDMFYAQPGKTYTKYKLDDNGNVVTMEIDGVKTPIDTGEEIVAYEKPIAFEGNINSQLHNAIVRASGTDKSDNYAIIQVENDTLPFKIGTRIWRKSTPLTKKINIYDNGVTKTINVTDGDSADYVVHGLLEEGLNYDQYYLQVLNHEG